MIGKIFNFPVWMSVIVSNISSSVPAPPGMTMNAYEYFTNTTLRVKKYRIVTERCT